MSDVAALPTSTEVLALEPASAAVAAKVADTVYPPGVAVTGSVTLATPSARVVATRPVPPIENTTGAPPTGAPADVSVAETVRSAPYVVTPGALIVSSLAACGSAGVPSGFTAPVSTR